MNSGGFGYGFSRNLLSNSGFEIGFNPQASGFVSNGLVLQYDIGNASSYPGSGNTVTDIVGNSNSTLTGSPVYSSGYLTFNGTNQHLMTNTSLSSKVTTDITSILMWAYPIDNGVLLSERGEASLSSGWHNSTIEMVAGTMKFGMWSGLSISSVTSTVTTPLNNWYHFAIVYDGTKLNAYVNGVSAGSVTFSRINPSEGGANIHYAIAGPDTTNMGDGTYANMRLGQFLVYNTALSQSDIEQTFRISRRTYGV